MGYFVRRRVAIQGKNSLEVKLKEQTQKAETRVQEIILEAKSKAVALLDDAREEEKERKSALNRIETRLLEKEEDLATREKEFSLKLRELEGSLKKFEEEKTETEEMRGRIQAELSKVA